MRHHQNRHHSWWWLGVLVGAILIGLWWRHDTVPEVGTLAANRSSSTSSQTSTTTTSSAATSANTAATSEAATKRAALQAKVQAYLNSVGADKTVSVTFKNLTPVANSEAAKDPVYASGSLAASVNGTQLNTSASTYKLFIAAYLFSHNYDFDATATDGFNDMIVNSENDFAEDILSEYGDATIDQYLVSQGWNNVFVSGKAASTTSDHLASLLTSLQAGTGAFSNASLRQWLLDDMGKQVYRDGIPAALGDTATVQDKVGFLDDVNNDAAIVTTNSGYRYILVIMTSGHDQETLDFSRIKTIAEQVNKLAYGA